MISSWDKTKAQSTYHFDPTRVDQPEDVVHMLGNIVPTWYGDLNDIIARSKPATWETRGYKGEGKLIPKPDLVEEEYDLESVGADPKMVITHLNWDLPPSLRAVSDAFGLDNVMNRIHVQMPGEVWNLHIDKLGKWCPEDPTKVMRVFVQLTDWQPGQFWEFGNYHWNQWSAGDVTCFDWRNMPHSTANAGHHPRVTLQITGVITEQTNKFLSELKQ